MIYNLGTDLVNIERISRLFLRYKQFSARILVPEELADLAKLPPTQIQLQANFLAKRFAAKEAFAKALGCGIGSELSFLDLRVHHNSHGQPYFEFSPQLQKKLQTKNINAHKLSISDEPPLAHAICILLT